MPAPSPLPELKLQALDEADALVAFALAIDVRLGAEELVRLFAIPVRGRQARPSLDRRAIRESLDDLEDQGVIDRKGKMLLVHPRYLPLAPPVAYRRFGPACRAVARALIEHRGWRLPAGGRRRGPSVALSHVELVAWLHALQFADDPEGFYQVLAEAEALYVGPGPLQREELMADAFWYTATLPPRPAAGATPGVGGAGAAPPLPRRGERRGRLHAQPRHLPHAGPGRRPGPRGADAPDAVRPRALPRAPRGARAAGALPARSRRGRPAAGPPCCGDSARRLPHCSGRTPRPGRTSPSPSCCASYSRSTRADGPPTS